MQVHELGRGQFGRVWLARWRGVEVAVKEPRRSACARARQETLAEAAMLASLRHPCVTALFGILLENVRAWRPRQARLSACDTPYNVRCYE